MKAPRIEFTLGVLARRRVVAGLRRGLDRAGVRYELISDDGWLWSDYCLAFTDPNFQLAMTQRTVVYNRLRKWFEAEDA